MKSLQDLRRLRGLQWRAYQEERQQSRSIHPTRTLQMQSMKLESRQQMRRKICSTLKSQAFFRSHYCAPLLLLLLRLLLVLPLPLPLRH